jgi:hypothetical protein
MTAVIRFGVSPATSLFVDRWSVSLHAKQARRAGSVLPVAAATGKSFRRNQSRRDGSESSFVDVSQIVLHAMNIKHSQILCARIFGAVMLVLIFDISDDVIGSERADSECSVAVLPSKLLQCRRLLIEVFSGS